jgi:hypothetical protein
MGKVTEMFLLLAFTGLDYERHGSHAANRWPRASAL